MADIQEVGPRNVASPRQADATGSSRRTSPQRAGYVGKNVERSRHMDVRTQMRRAMEFNRNRPAIITEDRRLSFAGSWERGCRLANGLISMGVTPGDRVAGLEDNNLAAADFFIGCAIAGAVRVPLYPRNSPEAHAHMVEHTDCRVLMADSAYADSVAELSLPTVIRGADYETWLASHPANDPDVLIHEDDW